MDAKVVQETLLALRGQYIAQLEHKVGNLVLQWEAIAGAPPQLQSYSDFQRQLHSLRGTAGSYGYSEVGDIAAQIETLLAPSDALPRDDAHGKISALLQHLAALAKVLALSGSGKHGVVLPFRSIEENGAKALPLLYIVDDDLEFCRLTVERIKSHARCETFHSKAEFVAAIGRRLPDAVIMDMKLPEGDLAGASAAMELTSHHRVPVIFVSTRDDEESRLAAIRAGADGYFLKQEDSFNMVALLDHLIRATPTHPYRVMLIDDDASLNELYSLELQRAGIQTLVLESAVGALKKLAAFMPEVILLDIVMPQINGLEFGALVRQYPAYNHIPIIYLSASRGEQPQLAAMRLGGDDFLAKPVAADYLLQLLLARLSRARVSRQGEYHLQETLRELSNIQLGLNKHSIVSIADLSGRITYVNEKFIEITGYSCAEVIGQNHRILKSGLHTHGFYEDLWQTIASGKIWNGEITNRRKDGQLYTVLSTIIPIVDHDGLPQRYLSVRTEITRIKQLNKELDKERERLSLALEATNTGIWEWNLHSNQVLYDSNWCRLLGYVYPTQPSWPMLIHPDDFAQAFGKLYAMLGTDMPGYYSEHRKQNLLGGWDWVIESGKVVELDAEGHPLRIMGTMQLINERKKIEAQSHSLQEQLNQAIKMEAVGHLTAGIAHDFNNILGAMLGYVELSQGLLNAGQDNAREKFSRYLGMVMSSGMRAKELIAQMLTFSRLTPENEAGQAPVIMLAPVLKEVVSLLRSSIPSSIELNYRWTNESLKARIQAVHLHQILLNLGINARDAIGEYGKIDIALSEHHADNELCSSCNKRYDGDYVCLAVRDSGKGIPGQILSKIFEPFFTTKEVGKGTGMGLPVVHGLVHALGGHIQVQSNAGSGTLVTILLPLESLADIGAPAQHDYGTALANLKGAKIMVVDDEHAMATMLHEFLSAYGARVDSYTDPTRALEAFKQCAADIQLVITDETMPGLSGLHLAEAMLKIRPDLPVILCTGYSEHANAEVSRQAGIAAFMHKPLQMADLLRQVAALLKSGPL